MEGEGRRTGETSVSIEGKGPTMAEYIRVIPEKVYYAYST